MNLSVGQAQLQQPRTYLFSPFLLLQLGNFPNKRLNKKGKRIHTSLAESLNCNLYISTYAAQKHAVTLKCYIDSSIKGKIKLILQ